MPTDIAIAIAATALIWSLFFNVRVTLPARQDPLRRLKLTRFVLESGLFVALVAHLVLPDRTSADGNTAIVVALVLLALVVSVNVTIARRGAARIKQSIRHEREALTDPLTGLFNRRYLDRRIEQEETRSGRAGSPFSLMVIDIDHFKRINDRFGHDAGDAVLKQLSQLVALSVRPHDVATRFGGEEFVVLAPDTDIEGATAIAERLRKTVSDTAFSAPGVPQTINATISIGVASLGEMWQRGRDVLSEADQCLYRAKKSGRDRVVSSRGRNARDPNAQSLHAGGFATGATAAA